MARLCEDATPSAVLAVLVEDPLRERLRADETADRVSPCLSLLLTTLRFLLPPLFPRGLINFPSADLVTSALGFDLLTGWWSVKSACPSTPTTVGADSDACSCCAAAAVGKTTSLLSPSPTSSLLTAPADFLFFAPPLFPARPSIDLPVDACERHHAVRSHHEALLTTRDSQHSHSHSRLTHSRLNTHTHSHCVYPLTSLDGV